MGMHAKEAFALESRTVSCDLRFMQLHSAEFSFCLSQLDHHLYTTPLPHTSNLPASHLPLHNFFLPSDLLEFVHSRAEAKLTKSIHDANLPEELHVYHELHTLYAEGTTTERSPRVFGFLSDVYRARCTLDGRLYCLRRIEGESTEIIRRLCSLTKMEHGLTGFKLGKEAAFSALDQWRRIRHPNIVSVREAFTTRLFNDSCEWSGIWQTRHWQADPISLISRRLRIRLPPLRSNTVRSPLDPFSQHSERTSQRDWHNDRSRTITMELHRSNSERIEGDSYSGTGLQDNRTDKDHFDREKSVRAG